MVGLGTPDNGHAPASVSGSSTGSYNNNIICYLPQCSEPFSTTPTWAFE